MFIFLDTATSGNGPDDRLCQIAFKPENGPAACELFNPGKPVSIDAKAHDAFGDILVLEKLFSRLNTKFQENKKTDGPGSGDDPHQQQPGPDSTDAQWQA